MSSMTGSGPAPRDRMDRGPSPSRGSLLQVPRDRSPHNFPPNDPYNSYNRPGPAAPGSAGPGPLLQEDAMYIGPGGHAGSRRQ